MSYGRDAYEAYRNHAGGKSLVSGAPIPVWGELPAPIQEAWDAAAEAAITAADPTEDV